MSEVEQPRHLFNVPREQQSGVIALAIAELFVVAFPERIRAGIPLPELAAYQAYMRDWVAIFVKVMHDVEVVERPLQYPDPDDEFFGYVRVRADVWYPPGVTAGTKEFVAAVCWVATGRLALEAGQFVPSRADCVALCQTHLDNATATFVTTVYQKCKREWDYKVPEIEADRRLLRELCMQALPYFYAYWERHG